MFAKVLLRRVVPHACWLLLQAIQLVNTLTKELDIHAAMESVRHVALELLQCERVTLFLVIESRQELRCAWRLAACGCWGCLASCVG